MKTLTALALVLSLATFTTATIATAAETAPNVDAMSALAEQVCASSFVLSDKAKIACTTKVFPKVLKDGTRFAAAGIGGEFNTLIRQITK